MRWKSAIAFARLPPFWRAKPVEITVVAAPCGKLLRPIDSFIWPSAQRPFVVYRAIYGLQRLLNLYELRAAVVDVAAPGIIPERRRQAASLLQQFLTCFHQCGNVIVGHWSRLRS